MGTCKFRQACFEAHKQEGTIKGTGAHIRNLDDETDIAGWVCGWILHGTIQWCSRWRKYSENSSGQVERNQDGRSVDPR